MQPQHTRSSVPPQLAGIEWDERAAYREFGGPPNNWDRATVDNNILSKLPVEDVEGSDWDPKSVMHYPFPPAIILSPEQYRRTGIRPPGGMSEGDILWARAPHTICNCRQPCKAAETPLLCQSQHVHVAAPLCREQARVSTAPWVVTLIRASC